jgi:hypothetical protein
MDIQQLDAALPISDKGLTLTTSSVGGLLSAFLTNICGGSLAIAGATKSVGATSVTISGTASLLNADSMTVNAVFALQGDGSVVATLDWTLPSNWTFSTSLPALPPFIDAQIVTPTMSLLDQLLLSNSRFVATTAPGKDPATGAPLAAGLNFISTITPSDAFGLFQTLLDGKGSLTIAGSILLPQDKAVTPPLPEDIEAWETTWPVPGIMLSVLLNADLSLDALRVHDLVLRIYSPTDATWLAANPSYAPALAVSGTIDVPSAGISGAVTAAITVGANALSLDCDFTGATVDKLEKLSDLVNGPDLATILPQPVQAALASITIESASIGLTGTLSAAAVDYVTLVADLPGVTWTLLSEPITIAASGIYAQFMAATPFTADRQLSVSLGGNVDLAGASFDVVTEYPGFETSLSLAAETSIPLKQIFTKLVPVLPAPPDLSVETMSLDVVPGTSYAFSARMADDPPWTLAIGPASMSIGAVTVDIADAQASGATGAFGGTLEFGGGIEVSVNYQTPGAFIIRGDFPQLKLSQLIAELDQIGVTLPSGFDIELDQAFALIEEQDSNLTLSAAAMVDKVGLVALTAQKSAQWGFAAGVQLGNGTISSLPGFGPLAAIESFLGLEEVLVIVSSIDQTGFSFPDMAQFQAPPLSGHSIKLPAQASGVVRGVNIYAALSVANNAGFKLLAGYLGVKLDGTVGITLSVSAPDPGTNSKLFLSVDTQINASTKLDGELGVLLLNNDPGAFLSATVKTSIQSQPVSFNVTAIVLPTGVLISGTMTGTITFSPVTLNNVAIEVGIDDAEIPSLGFAATIDIEDFESSIAIFFDSTDPSKSMFAGAVSDVTLLSIATAIAGQNNVPSPLDKALAMFGLKGIGAFTMPATASAALDGRDLTAIRAAFAQGGVTLPASDEQIFFVVNTAGSVWHLTDLSQMLHYELQAGSGKIAVALEPQFYCAPQATTIGVLPPFPEAIRVTAEIDEFLIKTQMDIEISPSTGISATAGLAPIVLFSANLFSITGKSQSGGPEVSLSTYAQPSQSDPQLRQPHFLLTGAVNLLGVAKESLYISVGENGLAFDFSETDGPVQFDLTATISSGLALSAGGSVTIGINEGFEASFAGVDLGHIGVDVSVSATLAVSASASGGSASVQGKFDFEGLHLSIPKITLDITGPALAHLADTIWDAVKSAIEGVLGDADQWLNWVKNSIVSGAVTAAEAVGNVLAKAYGMAADEIIDKTKNILGYTLDGVTQALNGAGVAAQVAADALVNAGYSVADVAVSIGKWFSAPHIDFSFGHIDTPAGPHADTPLIPHLDTPGAPHVDTPGAPHVDVSPVHADFGTHADSGSGFFHWDTSVGHADSAITPHVDTPVYPHIDTPLYPHVDTPQEAHVDTHVPPHVDTGTHIDT